VLQVVCEPGPNQGATYNWVHDPDQLAFVSAHLDLLAIGPGLETARIGWVRPRGRRISHPTSVGISSPSGFGTLHRLLLGMVVAMGRNRESQAHSNSAVEGSAAWFLLAGRQMRESIATSLN
jgi:hypothetical protein